MNTHAQHSNGIATCITFFLLLCGTLVHAQFIPISDVNFRSFIQEKYPAILNASLELDTVQASTITGTMNCRGRNIETMDEVKYFKNLSRIYAMNNKLTSFPYLSGFNNLTYIIVDSNQLTTMPAVQHISTLEELKCNYNKLTSLPEVAGLANLLYLKCSFNQLTSLPVLTGLNSLEMLYCENNQLTALPALSGSTQLIELKCSYNQLTSLPSLTGLSNLEIVYCENNQLTSLPNISSSIQLVELRCSHNQLPQLPPLNSLVWLKKLHAYNNQLTSIPSLTGLTVLEDLLLDSNQLASLPSLSGLSALKRLLCEHNELTSLPALTGLTALRELKCGSNNLTSIPPLTGLSNLVYFYCDDNQLTALPALTDCIKLDKIICSQNQLTTLPDLSTLALLKRFFCADNQLTSLPDLSGLNSLQGIFISNNILTELPPSISSCTLLTELVVANNQISTLPNLSFMNNVIRVDVRNNHLTFEDILPMASHPDFALQFTVHPQLPLGTFTSHSRKEAERFEYSLGGIDAAVSGNVYTWNKDVEYFKTTARDSFVISKVQKTNAGIYTLTITNSDPRLVGISLTSVGVSLEVTPCLSLSGIQYDIPEVHCNEYYSLTVGEASIGNGNAPYSYTLVNQLSKKEIQSNTNVIEKIPEGIYILSVSDSNGCEVVYEEKTIVAPRPSDCDASFSPNDDGVSDVYFIEATGRAAIYDSQGALVAEMNTPEYWNGTNSSGDLASAGYYVVVINGNQKRTVTLIR